MSTTSVRWWDKEAVSRAMIPSVYADGTDLCPLPKFLTQPNPTIYNSLVTHRLDGDFGINRKRRPAPRQ